MIQFAHSTAVITDLHVKTHAHVTLTVLMGVAHVQRLSVRVMITLPTKIILLVRDFITSSTINVWLIVRVETLFALQAVIVNWS